MAFRDRSTAPAPRRKARRSSSKKPVSTRPVGVLAPKRTGVFARPVKAPDVADKPRARRKVQAAEDRLPGTTLPVKRLPTLAHPTHRQAAATVREQGQALKRVAPAERVSAFAGNADAETRRQLRNARVAAQRLGRDAHVARGVAEVTRDPGAYGLEARHVEALHAAAKRGRLPAGLRGAVARIGASAERAGAGHAIRAKERAPHGGGAGLEAVAGLKIGKASTILAAEAIRQGEKARQHLNKGSGGFEHGSPLNNALKDALHLPYDAINAGVQTGLAARDVAVHGDTRRARAIGKGTAQAFYETVRHPLKSAGDHPLDTALTFAGGLGVIGRTSGAVTRGVGSASRHLPAGGGKVGAGLRAAGDTRRPDLVLEPGAKGLRVSRSYSKNLLIAAEQKRRDRVDIRKGLGDRKGLQFRGTDRARRHKERQAVHEFQDFQQNVGRNEREASRRDAQTASGARVQSRRQAKGVRAEAVRRQVVSALRDRGVEHPERMSALELARAAEKHGVAVKARRPVRDVAAAKKADAKQRAGRLVPTKVRAPRRPFSGKAPASWYLRPERELLVPAAKQLLGDVRSSPAEVRAALHGEIDRLEQAFTGQGTAMDLAARRRNRTRVGAMRALATDLAKGGKAGARAEARVRGLMKRAEEYRRVAHNVSAKHVAAGTLTAGQARAAAFQDYAVSRFADKGVRYDERRAPTDADAAAYGAAKGKVRSAVAGARGAAQEAQEARVAARAAGVRGQRVAAQRRARKRKPGVRANEHAPSRVSPDRYAQLPKFYRGVRGDRADEAQATFDEGGHRGGPGLAGDGLYASSDRGMAKHYAQGVDAGIAEFALHPNARGISVVEAEKLAKGKETAADAARRLGYDYLHERDAVGPDANNIVVLRHSAMVRPGPAKAEAKAARKAAEQQALQRRAASAEVHVHEERMRAAAASARAEHVKAGLKGDELTAAVRADPQVVKAAETFKAVRKRIGKMAAPTRAERRADALWVRERMTARKAAEATKAAGAARRELPAKPREFVRGLVVKDGDGERKLTQAEVEQRFREEYGPDAAAPAFVSARPDAQGAGAYFVNWLGRSGSRKSADTYRKTGRSEALGINAHGEQAAIDALVHSQGVLSAAKNWDRFIGGFGVRSPKGRLMTWDEAEDLARSLHEGHNAELTGRGPYVPVRVAPGRYDTERIEAILRGQAPGDSEEPKGVIPSAVARALAGDPPPDRATARNVVLVPKHVLETFGKHQSMTTSELAKLGQAATNAFRSTVLPLSVKWLTGNVAEGILRLAVAGATPVDVALGRRFIRDMLANDAEWGQALLTRGQGGLLYGTADRSIHREASMFDETALEGTARAGQTIRHLPVVKQAIDGYMAFAHTVFTFNKWIEQQFQAAVIGKDVRRRVQEDTQSWSKSWQVAVGLGRDAYRDALQGATNTPAQVRFARAIDETLGKYSRFSPQMRRVTQTIAPFLPWYANALRFVYWTLPVKHPVKTALLASVEKTFAADMQAQADALPPGDLGANPRLSDGGIVGLSRYTPFGAFTSLGRDGQVAADSVLDPLLPQVSSAMGILRYGKDAFGRDLQTHDGSDPHRAALAAYSMIEAFLPAAQVARRLREKGSTGFSDSTFWAPQTKPNTSYGRSAAGRIFNPFEPTYLSGPARTPGPVSSAPARAAGDPRMARLAQLQARLKVSAQDPRMARLAAIQAAKSNAGP